MALHAAAHQAWLPGGVLATWLAAWTNLPGFTLTAAFQFLLVPDGHLPSRRWRPVAWAGIVVTVVPSAVQATLAWTLRGPGLLPGVGQPRLEAVCGP